VRAYLGRPTLRSTLVNGVRSEVGRLRTVLLHRPGNELRRLTPRNNDALLFDGIPWVDRAQEEHDGFAEALRRHEVEVLYLSQLLVDTLADRAGISCAASCISIWLSSARTILRWS
jgi:arginine deiminase